MVLETLTLRELLGEGTYTARVSQEASKVEAKPNMAIEPKLRWGWSERSAAWDMGTHSNDLLQLEGPHLVAVHGGTGPFWVQHGEVGQRGGQLVFG
jgi:hypothetical protein